MVKPISSVVTALVLPSAPPDDILYVLEYNTTMIPPWIELAERKGDGDWIGQMPIQVTPLAGDREQISFTTLDSTQCFYRLRMELVTP